MTRLSITLLYLAFFSIVFSSCSKVIGTGPQIADPRPLSDFSSISLAMDATVNITQDSFYKVEVLAQHNIADEILTTQSGQHLTIRHRNNVIIKSSPITINITMPSLKALNVSGSGAIQLINSLGCGDLDLTVSGSGDIDIPVLDAQSVSTSISGSGKINVASGQATALNSKISGSGDLSMLNVMCDQVNTVTSGSGTTKVYAVNSLFAKISGSGDVYYRGNPSVEVEISGSGKLIKQ